MEEKEFHWGPFELGAPMRHSGGDVDRTKTEHYGCEDGCWYLRPDKSI